MGDNKMSEETFDSIAEGVSIIAGKLEKTNEELNKIAKILDFVNRFAEAYLKLLELLCERTIVDKDDEENL